MFGGKTSELYRQLNLKVDLGLKVLYINSRLDTRSDKPSSTHGSAGSYLSPSIETIKSEHLNNIDRRDIHMEDRYIMDLDNSQYKRLCEILYNMNDVTGIDREDIYYSESYED